MSFLALILIVLTSIQWWIQTLNYGGGHGFVLLALSVFLPSVISSFFFTQNKGGLLSIIYHLSNTLCGCMIAFFCQLTRL